MAEPRLPWQVPGCPGPDVGAGLDSDDDGEPDSVFTEEGADLLLHTDLDGDGLADRSLRLGPDGHVAVEEAACPDPPSLLEVVLRWLRG